MAPTSLLAKLGLFVVEDFLAANVCARLRAEMVAGPASDAKVGLRGRVEGSVVETKRKSTVAEVSAETRAFILERLLALKPRAERHFNADLSDVLEWPKFLIYRVGDFFGPHMDRRTADEIGHPVSKRRRVNLVIFLNGESAAPAPEAYCGGSLMLYGLLDKTGWETVGFPVSARTGLLVGFRSGLYHEVTPITHGERYNIVTRFLDPHPTDASSPDHETGASEY